MPLRHVAVLAAGALTILAAAPLDAQEAERPNLKGSWALSMDDSDFGMSPPPDSALIVIERADEHVVMTRTSHHPAAGGANANVLDMPANGETHQATTGDTATDASVEWKGATLNLWIVAQANVGDVDVYETWTVSEDGAQLTVDRLIEVPGMGEFEQTLVFDRRE